MPQTKPFQWSIYLISMYILLIIMMMKMHHNFSMKKMSQKTNKSTPIQFKW